MPGHLAEPVDDGADGYGARVPPWRVGIIVVPNGHEIAEPQLFQVVLFDNLRARRLNIIIKRFYRRES